MFLARHGPQGVDAQFALVALPVIDGRALVSMDRDPETEGRLKGRGRLQHADRAFGERDRGHSRVLDIDVIAMSERADLAKDLGRITHKPLQMIDRVHRLVHEDAAAFGRPFAPPRIGAEVLWTAPDADGAFA